MPNKKIPETTITKPRKDHTALIDSIVAKDTTKKRKPSAAKKKAFIPPKPPAKLDADGLEMWNKITKALHDEGLYKDKYEWALHYYSTIFSLYNRANDKVINAKESDLVIKSERGGMYRNPWLDVFRETGKVAEKMWVLLGGTILDDERIINAKKGTKSPVEEKPDKPTNPFMKI
jgi:phage terminase small subunit